MKSRRSITHHALSPLLALASTTLTIIVSSRTNDARVAQGASSVGVLPLIGLGTWALMRQSTITAPQMLISSLVVALADGGLLWLAVRLFERERILTRWK